MAIRTELRWVFDKTKIEKRLDSKRRRVLARTGGYGLKVMRSLFRRRRKSASVGSPPSAHGKSVLKKNVRFEVSGVDHVVVGPTLLPGQSRGRTKGPKPVPAMLDQGGTGAIRFLSRRRKWSRYQRARWGRRPFVVRTRQGTAPKFIDFMESEGF